MSTRLLKSKGVRVYVEAARLLLQKKINVRFVLIGFFEKHHPDSITELELRVWQKRGLIQYNGFARDVRPYLRQADCFVFPSFYSEGVPRCLLEASSMEIPIITSLNRGCTEVVEDGLNGLLTNVNDIRDLAAKMEIMMAMSSEARSEMGKRGRVRILEKFDVKDVIAAYDQTLLNSNI
jgi:glycosyltransferase involved in cell wall biosynthesis